MVFEELEQARAEMERTQEELKVLLLPRDPNDEKNVIVEIRGGAGGGGGGTVCRLPPAHVFHVCRVSPVAD